MDITDALAPTSDQLDAVELVNPRTFTIDDGCRLGTRDGKTVAEIRLAGFPRVWRPSKGMLDVLARCWGTDGKAWVGRSVTLYNDPDVTFGKDKVGGIRISHLSHIDGPKTVAIRGRGQGARKIQWKVEPLPDAPKPPTEADVNACTDRETLRAWWQANPALQAAIKARVDALDIGPGSQEPTE
ncbi:hypothetical protein [Terrabacter sp. C0L_2]|uniref:hypothetical protein n=1 Tax=Terrabacter sp. C0L_2 TaxID=3108389 RepID=UPI002ED05C6E|nr:hypothetical protein U5C87_17640 [Terrabacter sp. C0L_2]